MILLLLGIYGYYNFAYASGSRFTAEITYKFIPINQTKNVTISKDDQGNGLKIVELNGEASVSTFVDTTGEKPKGERSKGEVTIFNPTTEIKEIPSGTGLLCISATCNGLTFTMDNTLNVGPGSSEIVKVTAGDIGLEYNLAAGAGKFQVASYDPNTEVIAQNIKAFSGGTKKDIIKVVTQADIEKAEAQGMDQLKTILLSKIKNDPANKEYILSEASFTSEKIETKPDHKVDEEAQILNVSVKAKGKVNAFAKNQVDVVFEELKKEATPAGYYLDPSQTKPATSNILNQTADSVEISVTLSSIARPNIDIDKLKKDLAGKKYSQADEILKAIPNTTGYTKSYYPTTLPEYFWKIPGSTNRITIILVAE